MNITIILMKYQVELCRNVIKIPVPLYNIFFLYYMVK